MNLVANRWRRRSLPTAVAATAERESLLVVPSALRLCVQTRPCESSSKHAAAHDTDRSRLAEPVRRRLVNQKQDCMKVGPRGGSCDISAVSGFAIWRRTLSELANGGEFFEGVFISDLGIVDPTSCLGPQVTRPGSLGIGRNRRLGMLCPTNPSLVFMTF